jgi:hypothetical protein
VSLTHGFPNFPESRATQSVEGLAEPIADLMVVPVRNARRLHRNAGFADVTERLFEDDEMHILPAHLERMLDHIGQGTRTTAGGLPCDMNTATVLTVPRRLRRGSPLATP